MAAVGDIERWRADWVKGLGVHPKVWDEVVNEFATLPKGWMNFVPTAFDVLMADWLIFKTRTFDYTRSEGMSDHAYVRFLLGQARERIDAEHPPDSLPIKCDKRDDASTSFENPMTLSDTELSRDRERAVGDPKAWLN